MLKDNIALEPGTYRTGSTNWNDQHEDSNMTKKEKIAEAKRKLESALASHSTACSLLLQAKAKDSQPDIEETQNLVKIYKDKIDTAQAELKALGVKK